MIGKIFGFIGNWLGYIILGLIGIALFKFFVLPPENPDSIELLWELKVNRQWENYGGEKFSELPPFIYPQKNIKCFDDLNQLGSKRMVISSYNEYLITESLKARVLLLGGRGEGQRLESINSMFCEDKHDAYFLNNFDSFQKFKKRKLLN